MSVVRIIDILVAGGGSTSYFFCHLKRSSLGLEDRLSEGVDVDEGRMDIM